MEQAGIYHTGLSKGHHHKGPRQAGNKSLLSFRAGHGITGYVGFIPSTESIPIPHKEGPSLRASDQADRRRAVPEWEFARPMTQQTVYQETHDRILSAKDPRPDSAPLYTKPKPIKTKEEDFGGVGGDRPPPRQFVATSSHKAEFKGGKGAALIPSRVSRPKSAFIAPSTYSSTIENSVELLYGKDYLANKPPRKDIAYGKKWKEVIVQPHDMPTTYQTDYGEFGDGIMEKLPDHHLGISQHGSTKHLFKGTSKVFKRMPGYCGFMPSSDVNTHAIAQSTNDHERKDPKNCRLFNLQQYLREIPGTLVFQPIDAANLMGEPKGRDGTATAYANAILSNPATLQALAKQRAEQKTYGSTQATKTFFQGGALAQSENGVKNAESFYRLVRPYEGLPRVLRPSLTTESGYNYSCYMAKV
uniref:Uncharacterized protein n=1 Tax=Hemiselmis tepida TaxID=464990 RepID=A0A7S0VGR9_9CRYP|mmetsp:Transcript_18155/g.45745  ORF Transcript_18155/g.45745 Transcript_18155/m.45745 type:complete len:416 (+) Transcript_18155:195-1442(+)|eukprot:CAMPEP_0174929640 /NCGR_PEP_ID=MMETSP1355-20121228/28141_1 /TAXON_ID=464990 /ORGANISM="Hemiselmis tepida, Strain CCMP443" /LENGTH=415 /DNA_ID=CAMNT_0016175863 /DNA_START=188 /DNA_END=1435 /DNA_ORIENTATION=+